MTGAKTMIPIKNFKNKPKYLAKEASNSLDKNATLVKNFKMPFIQVISNKKKKGKK